MASANPEVDDLNREQISENANSNGNTIYTANGMMSKNINSNSSSNSNSNSNIYSNSNQFLLLRIANGIMALFFLYAAVVQLNDPDSWIWLALYFSTAVVCTLRSLYQDGQLLQYSASMLINTSFFMCLHSVWLEQVNDMRTFFDVHTEGGRERGGLSFVFFWLTLMKYVKGNAGTSPTDSSTSNTINNINNSESIKNVQTTSSAKKSTVISKFATPLYLLIIVFSIVILLSTFLIPKLIMVPDDVKTTAHCKGLGFSIPETNSDHDIIQPPVLNEEL